MMAQCLACSTHYCHKDGHHDEKMGLQSEKGMVMIERGGHGVVGESRGTTCDGALWSGHLPTFALNLQQIRHDTGFHAGLNV